MNFFYSISKSIFPGLAAILLSSCNQKSPNGNLKTDQLDTTNRIISQEKQIIATNDTLIVNKTCAVIVTADSLQIAKRKEELGDEFYIGADDYAFYLNETQIFLDSVKLKTIDCKGKKYLKFIYIDNKQEVINLTDLDELWKVYLFDPKRNSKSINMTMINEEYTSYFKQ
jgi:hypothetical protein